MEEIYSENSASISKSTCSCSINFLCSGNVEIPPIQRLEDHHVDVIFQAYKSQYTEEKSILIVGQFSLCKIDNEENDQRIFILDGQHRMLALRRLVAEFSEVGEIKTVVCLYTCGKESVMNDIYEKINSNKKVQLYITRNITVIMKDIKKYIRDNYKKYLSKDDVKSPRIPNFKLDKLEEQIKRRKIAESISDSKEFIDALEELNIFYEGQPINKFEEWGFSRYQEMRELMEKKGKAFYLGFYKDFEWLDRIKRRISGVPYELMSHTFNESIEKKREKIPKEIRGLVWRKRNGENLRGECYCCEEELAFENFECGHVVARCLGGGIVVDNLEPICKKCNLDMRTMNLEEYKMYVEEGRN